MIIEVSGRNMLQEINFENVFPYNEHISFENFVIDVENGFLLFETNVSENNDIMLCVRTKNEKCFKQN